ncbi:hypothetical protein BG015_002830 [Linnemannia schmuckeri]|uniref:Ion transport domain-containing protein n=1 Tax=Linnemannia schmuckeri TaxID=64567 RepID=A0A9P5S6F9_9FUNG|nr:hypothetical protein BG015_002830 [Linnemannia schmuckeri]
MTDYIVNISDDSQTTTLASHTSSPSADVHESSSAGSSSPNSIDVNAFIDSSTSIKTYRWYPQESVEDSTPTELILTLDEEYQPPVKINASRKTTEWYIPLPSKHKEGAFYDIVLGVSTQNLNIDSIESILIRFDQMESIDNGYEYEVIQPHELRRLSSLDSLPKVKERDIVVLRWKLFCRCYGYEDGVTMTVDFSTWSELPFEYGSLDLHFVELCIDSPTLYRAEHCPHSSWLIDVNRSGCSEYDSVTEELKHVMNFSYSGDGRFAAIKTIIGEAHYLEVWDLQNHDTTDKQAQELKNKGSVLIGGDNDGSEGVARKPYCAMPVAWMLLSTGNTDISISWDGSLVAVTDTAQSDEEEDEENEKPPADYQSLFAVYQCGRYDNHTSEKPSSRNSFVRHDVQRTCQGLVNYIGSGIFHMVDKSNPNLKDELFVTYNGISIDVYLTSEDWTPLHSIAMDNNIIASVEYTSDFVSITDNQLRGRYLVAGDGVVAFTFDIVLGAQISFTSALSADEFYNMSLYAVMSENGSLIAIPGFRGLNIYRTETWTLHGSYVFHEIPSDERVTSVTFLCDDSILAVCVGSSDNAFLQTRPGYLLDIARMSLVGRIAPDGCECPSLVPLNGSIQGLAYLGHTKLWHMRLEDRAYHSTPISPTRCTDLCKNPDLQENDSDDDNGTSAFGLHFKAETTETYIGSSHLKREKRSSLTVTMTDTTSSRAKKMVIPLPDGVSIYSTNFFSAYRYLLVETSDAFMAWSVPKSFEGDFRLQMVLYASDFYECKICPHGYVRCRYDEEEAFILLNHILHPISEIVTISFLSGLEPAVRVYELAEPGVKQDILRYYVGHLNYYPLQDDLTSTLLVKAVNLWSPGGHHLLCDFVMGLLSSSTARWVPLKDMPSSINPVAILLDFASKNSLAIGLLEIIVDYCLSQAKAEQDPHFLLPIRQCIDRLVDPKQQYPELVLKIYREMAYFPAQGREFIISHHTLAKPLNFRWTFWKSYPWGLHQHKDQVLQLDLYGTPNPPKGNFTRDIYQASFDLLWRKPEDDKSLQDSSQQAEDALVQALFSWPRAIWKMVLRKCQLRYNTTVECHPFELETLENPALKALVEYKWNTIGFNYWLVRFLGQVCYYILVLTAIFLQIYGNQEQVALKEGERYTDLGLDGLFLVIIVVAFIFLWLELVQLLKEKRGYIRYSSFECSKLCGGTYDPVERGFQSDSLAFHGIMMIFFFFTVIVMLNVLIALINNAISDGDQSWQLDWMEYRMRYIESAENMTYDIPGFRESRNYFPDTIYYTATGQQVRDYTKETQRLIDEAGPSSATDTTTTTTASVTAATVATVVEPAVSNVVDKKPTTTLVRKATVTAVTAASKAAMATAAAGGESDLMSMLRQQHEDQTRREEEQRRWYEEQMRRSDEQMKLLAEQTRRLEEQRLAMVDLQSELRLLKERGDR